MSFGRIADMDLPFADGEISDAANGLSLIRPSEPYLDSYIDACAETWNDIHDTYILHDPALADSWRSTIFDAFEKDYRGLGLPPGWLPSVALWAVRDGAFVGAVNIRIGHSSELIRYGGTYGYFIRTSKRGQGYGRSIARLGLDATRRLKVRPIVVTCQERNAASMAINEHLPYLRKERAITEAEGVVQPIWRYWFTE